MKFIALLIIKMIESRIKICRLQNNRCQNPDSMCFFRIDIRPWKGNSWQVCKDLFLLSFLLTLVFNVNAQTGVSDPLQQYIQEGLKNNLSLKQKQADWLQAGLRLRQAKGMFYPDLSLNARYTVADGGRIIDFPVGDLLNPVYSTLNLLTSSNNFPQIDNEQFPFLRPTEHETKLRLVQPLLNTDIFYHKQIQEDQLDIQFADMSSYKRSLVFEIKQAYYNYLKALKIKELLENTLPVLEENLRVNTSLFNNDKVTRDAVLRSEAEILKLKENLEAAHGSVNVSSAYFNFLLNRDLNDSIGYFTPGLPEVPPDLESYSSLALKNREEIHKLNHYSSLAGHNLDMNKSSGIPEIFAVVDYGYQGEEYRFTTDDDFVLASVVLRWDIFKGLQEKSKISEARILEDKVNIQRKEAENLIRLEVLNSWHELISAQKKLEATRASAQTTAEIFRVIHKKYGQDQASMLEFMDARNNMTMANQQVIINTFDLLIKYAVFEKACGLYNINNE